MENTVEEGELIASSGTAGSVYRCPPVLVLAFNRPDHTRRVLQAVRCARPSRLFVAVDGPRASRAGESTSVRQVQALVEEVDWPCEVRTLFREANLGCKVAVSQAITWFFDEVEAGIVLEDDCVAHPSFFPFAAELLERFRHDQRVLTISGDNFQFGRRRTGYSYYFSRYPHIWGWATWRRAWRLYDHEMRYWPEMRDGGWLLDVVRSREAAEYWCKIFDATYHERNTSWAYRWTYAAWLHSGLTVLPNVNLVSNIGFGAGATHTSQREDPAAALSTEQMDLPLRHPPYVIRDDRADRFTQATLFRSAPLWRRTAGRVYRSLVGAARAALPFLASDRRT
jgi:hypothetical protein